MFNSILAKTKPTANKVISSLDITETCAVDGKITTFLFRFIRSADIKDLESLLRFATGSSCLPDEKIKMQYVNQGHSYLAPTAATCFKILNIPRGYSTFAQFKDSLMTYLNKDSSWIIHDRADES